MSLPLSTQLRKAHEHDIDFVMRTERQPGFEWFVGRWDAARHREAMGNPANAYLIALDDAGQPAGFAMLRELDDPERNVYLQRLAMAAPGGGLGRRFLSGVVDWVFRETDAFRFWLHMKAGNDRADRFYRSLGFTEEGRLRQSHTAPDGRRADTLMFSMLRPEWPSAATSATTCPHFEPAS